MVSFSLVDEPWLPVRLRGGERAEFDLRNVLLRSHEIDDLIVDLPTQRPALLRQVLLSASIHRAASDANALNEGEVPCGLG